MRGQNQKWLHHLCLLGGPRVGGIATQPLRSRGVPRGGDKFRTSYITPTFFLGGPQLGRIATLPLHPQGPPQEGTKSEVATSPLPSQEPTTGRNSYTTLAFLGIPERGDEMRSGYITPAFSPVPIVEKDQSGYITSAFLGLPIVGRHEQETKRCLFSVQEWYLSIERLSHPRPPDFWGSIDTPQLKTRPALSATANMSRQPRNPFQNWHSVFINTESGVVILSNSLTYLCCARTSCCAALCFTVVPHSFPHHLATTRLSLRGKKAFVRKTSTNVHGDTLCFMVMGPSLLQNLVVGGWWRLGFGRWQWLAAVGGW